MKNSIQKILCGLAVLSVLALGTAPAATADGKDGKCPYSKHDCGKSGCDKSGEDGCESGCPIAAKFFKKAKFFLQNSAELGLSDKQVADIKALKTEMKKAKIRGEAEMQIAMLDLDSLLHADPINQEAVGAFMDKAAAGMAQSGKASVKALVDLKAVLTAEQMAKAKALWKAQEKGGAHH